MTSSKSRLPRPGRGALALLPLAALVLPLAAFATGTIHRSLFAWAVVIASIAVSGSAAAVLPARGRAVRVSGIAGTIVAGFLLGAATYLWSFVAASMLAAASAVLGARAEIVITGRPRPGALLVVVAAAGTVALTAVLVGPAAGGLVAAPCVAAPLLFASSAASRASASALRQASAATGLLLFATAAVAFTGATSPRSDWFGDLTWHGPRSSNQVALTFDDGPNGRDTLAVADLLVAAGARGTFFEVGKAVDREPEVTRALIEQGQIVADHSYSHSEFGFLRAGYPELKQTQAAIFAAAGICPALYRPPHGSHTPFLSQTMSNNGLRIVTWDVSASDWTEDDPVRLAARIVERAKPGSIILLHDGLDGRPGEDRSVVVAALPAILEGLKAKGLVPVGLDALLGVRAYLPAARCGG